MRLLDCISMQMSRCSRLSVAHVWGLVLGAAVVSPKVEIKWKSLWSTWTAGTLVSHRDQVYLMGQARCAGCKIAICWGYVVTTF